MNLYKLHKNPKSLDYHDEAQDKIVQVFWSNHHYDTDELRKKEKEISHSAEYSYEYAKYKIRAPFPLGEPAIATSAEYSYNYAVKVLEGRFKLGEPVIAKNGVRSFSYAIAITGKRFELGEKAIQDLNDGKWDEYKKYFKFED